MKTRIKGGIHSPENKGDVDVGACATSDRTERIIRRRPRILGLKGGPQLPGGSSDERGLMSSSARKETG